MKVWTLCSCVFAAAGLVNAAQAGVVTDSVQEDFADSTTDFTLSFVERAGQTTASGTSPNNGLPPGWTITGGEAVLYNNSNFYDNAAILVEYSPVPTLDTFSVSADFNVLNEGSFDGNYNYTGTFSGVVAYAPDAVDPELNLTTSGFYAYVAETATTGGSYRFILANNGVELDGSTTFDLTDGSPDYNVLLSGTSLGNGDVELTATLTDIGGQNTQTLSAVVASGDLPGGDEFGVRVNTGFNTIELGVDNIAVVIPEPGSLALAAAGLGLVLSRRRC
ncbi:MAG: PEP-CTERM sorting domain-containing protein [Planctomycetota bacterium]